MNPSWARLVPVICLVVGLTAGCSDDADPTTAEDTTTTAEGDSSTDDDRSAEELAADQAAAEEIVLTLDDLDPGWEATPATEDEADNDELEADLAECLGIDPEELDSDNPSADSPDFTSPDDAEVSATVGFAASVEAAEADMEVLRNDEISVCFPEVMKNIITEAILNPDDGEEPPDDMEVGEPTFNPISFADLGDDVVGYRATIPLSVSGLDVDYYFDIVTVRVGRVGVEGTFASTFSPFPTDEAERLLGIMVDRVPPDA